MAPIGATATRLPLAVAASPEAGTAADLHRIQEVLREAANAEANHPIRAGPVDRRQFPTSRRRNAAEAGGVIAEVEAGTAAVAAKNVRSDRFAPYWTLSGLKFGFSISPTRFPNGSAMSATLMPPPTS